MLSFVVYIFKKISHFAFILLKGEGVRAKKGQMEWESLGICGGIN